jgi:nucleotide-binding universal stress UspA family protein
LVSLEYTVAMDDFIKARQKAALEHLMARLGGKSDQLLNYEEVRQLLKGTEGSSLQTQEIPLDAIIGSVGRYNDFTRSFLPKEEVSRSRWAKVKEAVETLSGLPPIEVYKIGNAYFVKDGNHRVSVAHQLGATHILAYVTEIKTRVPLEPQDNPDTVILKAEYSNFLERTQLDKRFPSANLILTAPGNYAILEEHIRAHQYFLGQERNQPVSFEEAAASFYENVYLPILQVIGETGLLREFPDRSEADLYLWLSEHRAELASTLDMDVTAERAAVDLARQKSQQPDRIASRLGAALADSVIPEGLDSGPPAGTWRQTTQEEAHNRRLFRDILVPIRGTSESWLALDQALEIARREGSNVNGLHVIPEGETQDVHDHSLVQQEFDERCRQAEVNGHLTFQEGSIAREITARTRWNDLVVINLAFPPPARALGRLASGFRKILRRVSIPVLVVPQKMSGLEHTLLAFDGSPASWEALYLATYLGCAWGIRLSVLSVGEPGPKVEETIAAGRAYIEQSGIQASYLTRSGEPAEVILDAASAEGCDWLLTGTYGLSPVMEIVRGSVLDALLRKTHLPLLVSR